MKLNNQQIYEYAQQLNVFNSCNIKMPVRINFYLQKNIQLIQRAAEEIEQARLQIASEYGVLNENQTGYDIPAEKIPEVNKELTDLFSLEQDLAIHQFSIENFEGIELTYQQTAAIMFMIEE